MEKRKILGIVFIVLSVWGFLNMTMIYIKQTNQCQTLSQLEYLNPSYDTSDFTQNKMLRDKLCSEYPYGIKLFINLSALGYGIYLVTKDKKKGA